jgi:ribosomal protein S18 acetylase RimI-like enzyme
MDPTVTLRPEEPTDEAFLLDLYSSTRTEEMNLVPWDTNQKNAFLRMQFQLQAQHYHKYYPSAQFLVILLDDRPIGRIYVDRDPEQILLMDIALVPEHRNTGIGGRLMRELIAEAAATKRPLRIHVERNNPGAMRLYERLGFRAIKEVGIHFLMEWSPAPPAAG